MSIASAITAAQGKVANAYTAVSNKGGTLPATQNLSNLPTAISSIPSGGSVDVDNKSITTNSSDEIQTVGVINSRDSSTAIKTWTGTRQQYDAILSKDANTLYNITDDTDVTLTLLEALYPVGSVYITTANTCPLSALISGSTWTQETCRHLVEKKTPTNNDPSWYNLYSDGWCEQGGIASSTTITFSKEYTNTNYTLVMSYGVSNGQAYGQEHPYTKSTTGFTTGSEFVTLKGNWQACGYTSTTTSHKQFRRTA